MPRITYADNWSTILSTLADSSKYNEKLTHAGKFMQNLEELSDFDDDSSTFSIQNAHIIQKSFGYRHFNDISELHVLKLILNDKGNLCLKIAVEHPASADTCLVGTFNLDHALNIHSVDKLDTVQRKIPRLSLPKFVLPVAQENQNEKENTPPFSNIVSAKMPFWQQAKKSYTQLPVSDELLALLNSATHSDDEPSALITPHN